jgi:hypothetical protein
VLVTRVQKTFIIFRRIDLLERIERMEPLH